MNALHLSLWIPLAGALLIVATGRHPNLREAVSLVTAFLLFCSIASLAPAVLDGARPTLVLAEPLPDLALQLTVEPLGLLFALLASSLWIVTTVYSIGYMRAHQEQHQTRFYTCFALSLWAAVGMAFAGNLLSLFIFYEALTLSTYPLVTHAGTPAARRAGRVYLGMLLFTSIGFLLLAIVWTWQLAGTLDFTTGGILQGTASPALLGILLMLYIFGIGKAAIMPFHRWLPAAMVAPTPVSALLHAVAVVKGGVFFILKISIYVFGIDTLLELDARQWLLYVAAATILLAALVALRKDNLKARLAYSTISQLSYIVLGALLANAAGIMGSAMHIATHAFGKITLFFCAGAILVSTHKTRVSELAGIGRRMPWTMGAFAIASLAMIGMPPTAVFISKWYLLTGAVEADQMIAVGVLLLSTLLTAGYLLPVVYTAFFNTPGEAGNASQGEAPPAMLLALAVTTLGTLLLFCFPDFPLALARQLTGLAR
ncbi:MAG: monovalent cation/H+ antiporter subunit D family protein [Gammaproteobacteria bacterium]